MMFPEYNDDGQSVVPVTPAPLEILPAIYASDWIFPIEVSPSNSFLSLAVVVDF